MMTTLTAIFPQPRRRTINCLVVASVFALTSLHSMAANTYTVVRGAAQGGANYTIIVTGDPIHSLHVTGVNATGWTIYPAGEHLFGGPDWSPSGGLSTGFGWTAGDGDIAPPSAGFQFASNDFSINYTNAFQVSVDYQHSPDVWHPISTVPEPQSGAMLLMGIGLAAWVARRQPG